MKFECQKCRRCKKDMSIPEQLIAEKENSTMCSKCRWETKGKLNLKEHAAWQIFLSGKLKPEEMEF